MLQLLRTIGQQVRLVPQSGSILKSFRRALALPYETVCRYGQSVANTSIVVPEAVIIQRSGSDFRGDIEGLRGVAVLMVVLFHCGVPGFDGGFTGVDVFFALSGYLITGLIIDEVERTGQLRFRNFYARRVRRLLPASGLLVVVTLLLGLMLYSPLEVAAFAKSAYYTSLYTSNWMFMQDAANYFASDVALNPYLHTWSLAVEEQFYFFWPALIVLALSRTRSRSKLAAVLLALCLVSLTLSIWLTQVRQPWAFFSLPARAWEFGLGGLACLLPKTKLAACAKWLIPLGWAGLGAVLTAGCLYSGETKFPGYAALAPVAGTIAALISGASGAPSALRAFLGTRVLQHLGRLSYSWYLWHWPILLFAAVLVPSIKWQGKLIPAVIALVLAQITFLLVEKPIRISPFLVARPALSLSLALLIPLTGFTLARFVSRETYRALASSEQSRFWSAAKDPRTLFNAHCLTVAGVTKVSECEYGDRLSNTVAVLFGDSHAEHWFPALQTIAKEKHWRLVTLLKSSCPAARVNVYSVMLKRADTECSSWREKALERIAQMQPYAVIISESDGRVASDIWERGRASSIPPENWGEGLRSTLGYLDSHSLKTLVIADVPRAEFDVPICLSRAAAHHWAAQECLLLRSLALNENARRAETIAVSGFRSVRRADFTDRFCTDAVCRSVIDGQVVYRDANHLTSTFAQTLAPFLGHEIDNAVAAIGPTE
jgi:peptidoglycan/LPS O-acetylase OafA/YrhL